MRGKLMMLAVLIGAPRVHADVFAFTDRDGFEKCMQLDHLIETITTPTGAQTRMLGPAEIQPRCIDAAAIVLAHKTKDEALDWIALAKRLAPWELAVPLVGTLADLALPACNEMAGYEVLLAALARPKDSHAVAAVKPVVVHCLKDKQFKTDFLDEKDNADKTLRANACDILVEQKLIKRCK
jgi:hypothetical protein